MTVSLHAPCRHRSGIGEATARIIVGGEPLSLKSEKQAGISGATAQDKPAILKHAIRLRKGARRWVALVHMDVMDALPGAKLSIDWPEVGLAMWRRIFSAKNIDLAILSLKLHQILDQDVLEIVVCARPCLWNSHPRRPVKERRANIVERSCR